jgi:hypothetical protein
MKHVSLLALFLYIYIDIKNSEIRTLETRTLL